MSNLVYFQENSIRKPFVYISFEKLYKLGQPYKFGQKVPNYFVPEHTPPSEVTTFKKLQQGSKSDFTIK